MALDKNPLEIVQELFESAKRGPESEPETNSTFAEQKTYFIYLVHVSCLCTEGKPVSSGQLILTMDMAKREGSEIDTRTLRVVDQIVPELINAGILNCDGSRYDPKLQRDIYRITLNSKVSEWLGQNPNVVEHFT